MFALALLLLSLVALAAAAFAAVPVLRRTRQSTGADPGQSEAGAIRRQWLAPTLAGTVIFAGGLGLYALIGTPIMAVRDLDRPEQGDQAAVMEMLQRDPAAIVDLLARRMREQPNDPNGWALLGRNYLIFGNASQAVKALSRGIAIHRNNDQAVPPELLVNYAIALSEEAQAVTKAAEDVFREALNVQPKNQDARYYLGIAHASRGEYEETLKFWEELASEAGPETPWRAGLSEQIAVIAARAGRAPAPVAGVEAGAAPPNIAAMVERLATRLAGGGGELNDWLMLIRAYGVLGQPDKARAVFQRAKEIFAGDPAAQEALATQARQSGIE